MTWRTALLSALISSTSYGAALPLARAEDESPRKPKPSQDVTACAKVTASTRYEAYGYTHIVTLRNSCDRPVACQVWTDVDPSRQSLNAGPGQSASLVTRKGSPAREVVAQSECKLAK